MCIGGRRYFYALLAQLAERHAALDNLVALAALFRVPVDDIIVIHTNKCTVKARHIKMQVLKKMLIYGKQKNCNIHW